MPIKWKYESYRKLYTREQGEFAQLPLFARTLAAYLLKLVDDDGEIDLAGRGPAGAIAFQAGATQGDRRMLRKYVPMLMAEGYLYHDVERDRLGIRNFLPAQEPSKGNHEAGTTRAGHESVASRARAGHESVASRARAGHESVARSELSPLTARGPTGDPRSSRPDQTRPKERESGRDHETTPKNSRSDMGPHPDPAVAGKDSLSGGGGPHVNFRPVNRGATSSAPGTVVDAPANQWPSDTFHELALDLQRNPAEVHNADVRHVLELDTPIATWPLAIKLAFVRAAWELQERLREQLGGRRTRLDDRPNGKAEQLLRDFSHLVPRELAHAVLVAQAEAEAKRDAGHPNPLEYFNGVSNWRPESVQRALGTTPEQAALAVKAKLQREKRRDGKKRTLADHIAERDAKRKGQESE